MVNVFIDGSFMPETKEGAYGGIIKLGDENITFSGKLGKSRDNNVTEYQAMLKALEKLYNMGLKNRSIKIHTDCQVLTRQLSGLLLPPTSREHAWLYGEIVKTLKQFTLCIIDYVSSKYNPAHTVARNALN